MKSFASVLVLALILVTPAMANDKGNTVDEQTRLSPMGNLLGNGLYFGLYLPLLSKKILRVNEGTLLVSGLGLMAGAGEGFVSLSEIVAAREPEIRVGAMRSLIDFVVYAVRVKETALIDSLLTKTAFYPAFSTMGLKASLENQGLTKKERKIALRMIDAVTSNFWRAVRAAIVREAGSDGWAEFSRRIDQAKLGHTLPRP